MQILDNLISNAVKFSPHKSTVRVTVSLKNGNVCLRVSDQGPGLSADDQKKLFGKFTRLSAQPTGGESSTGLGLSIVKKLAVAMAGDVYCESQLGSGATFILRLPACDDPASVALADVSNGAIAANRDTAALAPSSPFTQVPAAHPICAGPADS